MIRGRWIWDESKGELVPAHEYRRTPVARSSLPAPMVIRDIEPYRSQVDGSVISSRSQHRDHLRAHGMVELGNEMPSGPKLEEALKPEDIAEAYDQIEAGYHPPLNDNPPEYWEGPIEETT